MHTPTLHTVYGTYHCIPYGPLYGMQGGRAIYVQVGTYRILKIFDDQKKAELATIRPLYTNIFIADGGLGIGSL